VKADILRLAYLFQNGGFYADIDDRCVKSLEHIRSSGAALCGYQEDVGSFANNILGAIPRHPVIGRALEGAAEAVLRGDADMPWLSTGPGLVSRAFVQWLAAADGTMADKLATVFFPDYPQSFGYFSIHCFASYKVTPQHWGRRIFG
jgi:mannosyltransferase OCH1-like enzyme